LTFLADSGLEDIEKGAYFTVPIQTFKYANIKVPKTISIKGMSGAGTVILDIGYFSIKKSGLEATNHEHVVGMYRPFPPPLYHNAGFIVDELISHSYPRHYAWTIDFEEMTMILAR
jgi:hypothetical protein